LLPCFESSSSIAWSNTDPAVSREALGGAVDGIIRAFKPEFPPLVFRSVRGRVSGPLFEVMLASSLRSEPAKSIELLFRVV